MKNRIFFGGLLILFLLELVVFAFSALPKEEKLQDTVAVNEVVKTVQKDWNSLEEHRNRTSLEYVVLGSDGAVLYRTEAGLSESMNAAISHKDTILDIEVDGVVAGKVIVYNNDALVFQSESQRIFGVIIVAMILQCCICAAYFFYIRRTVIKPFYKMKGFAERIAGGNLDIPL